MSEILSNSSNSASGDIKLTIFSKKRDKLLTKKIRIEEGKLLKDASGCAMSKGMAKTVSVRDLSHFNTCLDKLKPNQALSYGVAKQDENKIVARKDAHLHPDAITRSKGNFKYPEKAILMFDYDPELGEEALPRDDLYDILLDAVPQLYSTAMLWRPSASSCLYHGDKEIVGISGQRFYIVVDNGELIPHIGEIINKRLWLVGYGRIMISKSGALLPRSPIDTSVWQPERLDFAAGALCVEPLERRPVAGHLYEGDVLDTTTIEALTNEEEAEYCLLYTSPSPRDQRGSRMPSSA